MQVRVTWKPQETINQEKNYVIEPQPWERDIVDVRQHSILDVTPSVVREALGRPDAIIKEVVLVGQAS